MVAAGLPRRTPEVTVGFSGSNGIPFLLQVRPAATTRGFGPGEFRYVGELIAEVLDGLAGNPDGDAQVEHSVRARVSELCARFPIYGQA